MRTIESGVLRRIFGPEGGTWGWRKLNNEFDNLYFSQQIVNSNYGSTAPCWVLAAFFTFLILYTVGRTPWTEDEPVARPLPTHRTQTQNKRT
jgi:hypothetical protein